MAAKVAMVAQPSNMPADNPVRRVDIADIEELNRRFRQNGDVKFCRCFASKQFPFCDGSHVELNKQGITNAGPLVVKAPPLPNIKDAVQSGSNSCSGQPSNMPADNPVRRVDFANIEELNTCCQDGEKKFCRCFASKSFPFCDGSHVALNKEGVTNAGPIVIKKVKPTVPKQETPWGTPMPQFSGAALSGDGTLKNVGIKLDGQVNCSGCKQKFETQKVLELHWKFMHDFRQTAASENS